MIDVKSMNRREFEEYLQNTIRSTEMSDSTRKTFIELTSVPDEENDIDNAAFEAMKEHFHMVEQQKEIFNIQIAKMRLVIKLGLFRV
jgi:hypothetical protein